MKLPAFKSTKLTKHVAYALIGLYLLYGMFSMPISVLLFSAAVGLIVLGTINSMELAVAAAIAVGLVMRYVFNVGVAITHRSEGFMTADSKEVSDRLATIRRSAPLNQPLSTGSGIRSAALANGILASSYSEGFADADTTDGGSASATGKKTEKEVATVAAAPSAAASGSASGSSAEKFTDAPTSDGLFKLGALPSESKSGPHLDASSTLLNAISGLKPDQVKSMTEDTRKLLDTQKSLMGMLETMKPLLVDGQSLINTFGTMFGGKGGADGAMAAIASTGK